MSSGSSFLCPPEECWLGCSHTDGLCSLVRHQPRPIFWLLIAEIYPLKMRGIAEGSAAGVNWAFNFLVSITFLTLVEVLGPSLTFWVYGWRLRPGYFRIISCPKPRDALSKRSSFPSAGATPPESSRKSERSDSYRALLGGLVCAPRATSRSLRRRCDLPNCRRDRSCNHRGRREPPMQCLRYETGNLLHRPSSPYPRRLSPCLSRSYPR